MDYETLTLQSKLNSAIEAEELNKFALLKPYIFIDGNKWCVMYGEKVQESIRGFGFTPMQAIYDFNKQFDLSLEVKP